MFCLLKVTSFSQGLFSNRSEIKFAQCIYSCEKPQLNFKSLQLVIGPKTFRNFGQLAAQKDHFANFGFCGCKTSDFDSKQIIRNCFFKLNIRKNIKLLNRRPRCGLKSLQSCQKLDHTQMDVLNCVHLFLKECTCSKFVKHQTFKVKKCQGRYPK